MLRFHVCGVRVCGVGHMNYGNGWFEVKASQYRRPTKDAQKRPHKFSRIIVCATCMRPLRVTLAT